MQKSGGTSGGENILHPKTCHLPDKAMILTPVQKYGLHRILADFFKINCKRKGLDTLLEKKHETLTKGTKTADQSTCLLETA